MPVLWLFYGLFEFICIYIYIYIYIWVNFDPYFPNTHSERKR